MGGRRSRTASRTIPCSTGEGRELQGRIRFREIGSTRVRRIAGTEHTFRRRDSDIRRGGDPEELNLLFVNRGTTVVEQDGRTATLTPGDFLLYDSARPFEFRTRGALGDILEQNMRESTRTTKERVLIKSRR